MNETTSFSQYMQGKVIPALELQISHISVDSYVTTIIAEVISALLSLFGDVDCGDRFLDLYNS